jgi:hypothetical protein
MGFTTANTCAIIELQSQIFRTDLTAKSIKTAQKSIKNRTKINQKPCQNRHRKELKTTQNE